MFEDRLDETRTFLPLNIAVMTVSDTRGLDEDKSGDTLVARLQEAGHKLADRAIVKDEVPLITGQLKQWIATPDIDVVISTGGTGLTGRDVTPEAFHSVFEKEIDGFSYLFHQVSFAKIGTSTIQSRAKQGNGHRASDVLLTLVRMKPTNCYAAYQRCGRGTLRDKGGKLSACGDVR